MKVLFVYSGLVVDDVNGVYHHNFLDAIIKRYKPFGELTICVSRKVCSASSQTQIDSDGVHFRFVEKENSFRKRFLDGTNNKRILQELVADTDWLIVHVSDSVASLAAKYARLLNKTYLAVVIGCPWDSLWNHSLKGKCLAPFAYYTIRETLQKAPFVVYVTDSFLQHRYPTKGEWIVCSDVALPNFDQTILKNRIEKLDKVQPPTLKVITVGAVNIRVKGQEDVLNVIPKLKKQGIEVHYYLVGGGDDSFLRSLASKLKIESQVHFMGVKSHDEVFSLLDKMDMYVQPSRTEGLSRALVEAMSRGLPCLGTNVGGIPELLQTDCLYKPGDVQALMNLVLSFTPEKMKEKVQVNFERAKDFREDILDQRRWTFLNHIKSFVERNMLK